MTFIVFLALIKFEINDYSLTYFFARPTVKQRKFVVQETNVALVTVLLINRPDQETSKSSDFRSTMN